jgi:hypothetical protein
MKFIYKYNIFLESINNISDSYITYHATNTTWKIPEIKSFGFHSGTLKSAKDRMNSFNMSSEQVGYFFCCEHLFHNKHLYTLIAKLCQAPSLCIHLIILLSFF